MGCIFTIHTGKVPLKEDEDGELEIDAEKALKTDNFEVGECSFLKAALFEDEETFIPYPIRVLSELIDNYKEVREKGRGRGKINEDLIKKVADIEWKNDTSYKLCKKEELLEFLKSNKGKECYYVCW